MPPNNLYILPVKSMQRHLKCKLTFLIISRYGILHIARVGSVITTLSVAMDRFYVIKHPLIVHERATFLVSSCVVFSVLYNIPRFFEFQTIYLEVMDNSSVVLSPNGKEEVRNSLLYPPKTLCKIYGFEKN